MERIARLRKHLDSINSGRLYHGRRRHGSQDWFFETTEMKAYLEREIEYWTQCEQQRNVTRPN